MDRIESIWWRREQEAKTRVLKPYAKNPHTKKFRKASKLHHDVIAALLSNVSICQIKRDGGHTLRNQAPNQRFFDLQSLFVYLRQPHHDYDCLRWDGQYRNIRPVFGPLKLLPASGVGLHNNPQKLVYVDKFLFYAAFGPIPPRLRINRMHCMIGCPRNTTQPIQGYEHLKMKAAWCVNPYHADIYASVVSDRAEERVWTPQQETTVKTWDKHKTAFEERHGLK